jgi:hypothetical protein
VRVCSVQYRYNVSRAWPVVLVSLGMGGGCRLGYEALPRPDAEFGFGGSSGGVTTTTGAGTRADAAGSSSQASDTAGSTSAIGGTSGTPASTSVTTGGAIGSSSGDAGAIGNGGAGANTSAAPQTGGTGGVAGGTRGIAGDSGTTTNGGATCRCGVGQGCVNDTCIPAKLVFVTSQTFGSMLGGVSGADQICTNAALSAKLPGQYLAWLSDSVTDPATRLARSTIPYALVSATVVANDWLDLIDGTLAVPIDVDENGAKALVAEVWTGTLVDGTRATDTCDGWTSASATAYGLQGVTDRVDSAWTDAYLQYCDRALIRLMCFQQ